MNNKNQFDDIRRMLALAGDGVEKLEMVMDLGAHLAPIPAGASCHEIAGCASRVMLCRVGNRFYGSADAAIVRGIVAILIAMVDGHSADQIRHMDLAGEFAGLHLELGAGRLNGVDSMIRFLQNL